jgi:hypothetical protein
MGETRRLRCKVDSRVSPEKWEASLLNHLNVSRVSDYFSEMGKHYLVVDYVRGRTQKGITDLSGWQTWR